LINAVTLHIAVSYLSSTQQTVADKFSESGAMEMLLEMAIQFDNEGRYHFFNACVNQLRFPNSHTHFFLQALLLLFLPLSNAHQQLSGALLEVIQEQITRVLVERLIIARPHPWGLLVTFIELMKNKRFAFWEKPFIRCTPEIEKMFETLLKSIVVPQAVSAAPVPAANQSVAPPHLSS
jgi:CCR4-NOT transcription complex subunit 1